MSDPLTDIVQLLDPCADFSKLVEASGPWRVTRAEAGRPFFCVVLMGACRLEIAGAPDRDLRRGDFLMIPEAQQFAMAAADLPPGRVEEMQPIRQPDGRFRLGPSDAPPSAQLLIGYCRFRSPDTALLLSLLPRVIHVREDERLMSLVRLVADETAANRPGREAIIARLLAVILMEALRTTSGETPPSGLLRGLADERLSAAVHRMHDDPARPWTMADLAREAGVSRTVFFERFKAVVGLSPMEHLSQWRMAIAKSLLTSHHSVDEVAERIGYGSASAFVTAFRRSVGLSPARYAKMSGGLVPERQDERVYEVVRGGGLIQGVMNVTRCRPPIREGPAGGSQGLPAIEEIADQRDGCGAGRSLSARRTFLHHVPAGQS